MYTKITLSMYSKTILVVDDMSFFVKMASDCFRREQVNILTAKSGHEAVEIIKSKRPDLVLMDLYMPEGNGDEVCHEIKNNYSFKSIPIIIMTSSENQYDIELCRKAGCDDFIQKPFSPENVLEICKKYLNLAKWSGERLKINVPVRYGDNPQLQFSGTLGDISVGGIFLETEKLLANGTEVSIRFQLSPDYSPIQCRGRVSWVNSRINLKKGYASGMGIEFIDIKKMEILAIQSWMRKPGLDSNGPHLAGPFPVETVGSTQ
jgi:CheY-like chemotaxis protein